MWYKDSKTSANCRNSTTVKSCDDGYCYSAELVSFSRSLAVIYLYHDWI